MLKQTLLLFLAAGVMARADETHGKGRLLDLTLGKAIRMALESFLFDHLPSAAQESVA